nr:hypothetical protein BaRGS_001846 [Batillaria attramentaria]
MLARRQLRDLLAKKQWENHAYFNTSYNFVCSCDFCRLCNKRDILIAGEIKPGSNTGISVDFIDYLTYDCYVDKAMTTGEHRNIRVASDGYLEPHPLMKSAATCAQVNTTTASGDTGNTDPGDREVSGSGGEGNDEYQDDYIAMGPAADKGSPGLSVLGQSFQLSPAVSHAVGIRLQVASPEFLISAAT